MEKIDKYDSCYAIIIIQADANDEGIISAYKEL